ncbi:hypothetical protein MN608_07994 [Microdochium nivale]|nr:hypothetical protein MN608_07994 [Microdochium nivale]
MMAMADVESISPNAMFSPIIIAAKTPQEDTVFCVDSKKQAASTHQDMLSRPMPHQVLSESLELAAAQVNHERSADSKQGGTGTTWRPRHQRAARRLRSLSACLPTAQAVLALVLVVASQFLLVDQGGRVVVDGGASLVSHVNSRGRFDLNRPGVRSRCVLMSRSRLLSGVHTADNSCVLEHTLVMGGDVVEEGAMIPGAVGQGVPQRFEARA